MNEFYLVLLPLPLMFLNAKIKYRYIYTSITLLFVLFSFKRSGVVMMVLITGIMLFYDMFLRKGVKVRYTFILILFVILSTNILMNQFKDEIEIVKHRIEMIQEDEGSGRITIWNNAVSDIKEFDLFAILLGKGSMSYNIKYPTITSSHNDFLEIMYSYGIIALLCYFILLLALMQQVFLLFKNRHEMFLPLMISCVCFLLYGMVGSLFYYQSLSSILFIFLGVYEGIRRSNVIRN